jgi:hypothetical protein
LLVVVLVCTLVELVKEVLVVEDLQVILVLVIVEYIQQVVVVQVDLVVVPVDQELL